MEMSLVISPIYRIIQYSGTVSGNCAFFYRMHKIRAGKHLILTYIFAQAHSNQIGLLSISIFIMRCKIHLFFFKLNFFFHTVKVRGNNTYYLFFKCFLNFSQQVPVTVGVVLVGIIAIIIYCCVKNYRCREISVP